MGVPGLRSRAGRCRLMTIPDWLKAHLESRGLWDADGVGRAARARRCKCREYVLAGLDADRCAFPAAVDVEPLSARGEAVALIAGRSTYSLRILSGRLELDQRSHFDIRGPQNRLDVLAGHLCGQPSLGAVPGLGMASRLGFQPVGLYPAEPPF